MDRKSNKVDRGEVCSVKFNVRLTEAQGAWLEEMGRLHDCSRQEVFRGLVARSMAEDAPELAAALGSREAMSPRGQVEVRLRRSQEAQADVLAAIEKCYNFAGAARVVEGKHPGASSRTIQAWIEADEDMAARVGEARERFMHDVETEMLSIGRGDQEWDEEKEKWVRRKGNVTALLAWLNAHHPFYGRIRVEVLKRLLDPFLRRLAKIAARYIPPDAAGKFSLEVSQAMEAVVLQSTQ